jgi:hypothetical protein
MGLKLFCTGVVLAYVPGLPAMVGVIVMAIGCGAMLLDR